MSSDDIAIRVSNLSKCYFIYDSSQDRLKQYIYPRLQRFLGRLPKNYFREFWALKDVFFEVKKGETVGIIGRNGSGKSTLLQIICGTLTPTCGTVETKGRVAALLELGSGFNPEFTGRENVYMNGGVLGLSKEEIDARFDDIAAFADIGEFIEQPVKMYSSGMYVRLAFAVAINVSPNVLVVDEALAVGDVRFQAKCIRCIKQLKESGTSILFVSHDISSIRTLCDKAVWLDGGGIRMQGSVFPVTGSFMEYMMADECPETVPLSETRPIVPVIPEAKLPATPAIDSKPVTHWGSHVGCIITAGIYNLEGQRCDVVRYGEHLIVKIVFHPPEIANMHFLSAAFSIKDMRGTDLFVSTTFDKGQYFTTDAQDSIIEVVFKFANYLVNGRYLLIAALEDRSSGTIHYYEYIEGAQYFASLNNEKLFGIFHPEIKQYIKYFSGNTVRVVQ